MCKVRFQKNGWRLEGCGFYEKVGQWREGLKQISDFSEHRKTFKLFFVKRSEVLEYVQDNFFRLTLKIWSPLQKLLGWWEKTIDTKIIEIGGKIFSHFLHGVSKKSNFQKVLQIVWKFGTITFATNLTTLTFAM
jgi:hypothetical protein